MLGKDEAFEILKKALSFSRADQMELVMMGKDHFLSRYANSQIHQNTAEVNCVLSIKAVLGRKIGVSLINSFDDQSLRQGVEKAVEAAKRQVEITDFSGLPPRADYAPVQSFCPRTAEINPEEKALVIRDMIERAHGDRISLSGAFYTGMTELAIMNTNGLEAYTRGTLSNIAVVASGKETSGYASASSRDVDELDHTRLIEEALESARPCQRTISLDPGEYPVILEEYAVAELLVYLSWMALTSESVEEGGSFVAPNKGQKLFGDNISLYDDALHPETFMASFDYEGVPKKRVDFIKNGTVTGDVTYNYYGARREGRESTGHGLTPDSGMAHTIPFHLFMEGGNVSSEDLTGNADKALLIKRFHYLTTIHPLKTLVSGMTRDGVFLVEKGKITARVKNLRFTQSIVESLKNVKEMSRERKKVWLRDFSLDYPFTVVVPRLYIDRFNFSGNTDF